jgi:hypothetical protein
MRNRPPLCVGVGPPPPSTPWMPPILRSAANKFSLALAFTSPRLYGASLLLRGSGSPSSGIEVNCRGLCGGYLQKFRESYGNSVSPPEDPELKRVGGTLSKSYPTRDYSLGGSPEANKSIALAVRVSAEARVAENLLVKNKIWDMSRPVAQMITIPWLFDKVRKGADWDHKFQLGCPEQQSIGNFNFGYISSVLGLSREDTLGIAGAAQMVAGTWRREFGLPNGEFPRGDDFKDAIEVEAGIRFYRSREAEILREYEQMSRELSEKGERDD